MTNPASKAVEILAVVFSVLTVALGIVGYLTRWTIGKAFK